MFHVPASLAPTGFRIALSLASFCIAYTYLIAAPIVSLTMSASVGVIALCAALSYWLAESFLILFIIALPAALLGAATVGFIWR